MKRTIYYLPGHGGRLETGLGEALLSRNFKVIGRETVGEFRTLPFSDQVAIVATDLTSTHWQSDALVIANSFGAYLFLHAQTLMTPYIGTVLLLSPIVGEFSNETTKMGFIPPQAGKLLQLVQSGQFSIPRKCEIHVGEQDWQSDPVAVMALASQINIPVTVVPNAGHMLGREYVSALLDRWLPQ